MDETNNGSSVDMQKGGPSKYVAAIVVLLIIIGGGYWMMKGGTSAPRTESTPLPDEVAAPQQLIIEHKDAPADWKKYTNKEFGTEISFPDRTFTQENADVELPAMDTKLVGTRFVHTLAIKSCPDLTKPDDCKPTTEDIAVGVFFIKKNFGDFLDALVKQTPNAQLVQADLDGRKGFMLGVTTPGGAQGIFQYFFPVLDGNAVMLLTRLYTNEEIATKYKGVKDYIPYAEQEKIFTQMVESVSRVK